MRELVFHLEDQRYADDEQKTTEERMLNAKHEYTGRSRAAVGRDWRLKLATLAVLAGVFASTQAFAVSGFGGQGGRRYGRREMPSVDDQVKRMTKQLKLSDDQQAKLRPVLEDQRRQMEQLRNDSSLSRDDKFSKMREVHAQTSSQIKALLNQD
jgi:hypothetical protein